MKKLNKLLVSLILVFIGFIYNMNIAKADTINGTCEYKYKNAIFTVNIKNSKITSVTSSGSISGYKAISDASVDISSISIKDFKTSGDTPKCPSPLYISYCDMFDQNKLRTFKFAMHTSSSLSSTKKNSFKEKCGGISAKTPESLSLNKSNLTTSSKIIENINTTCKYYSSSNGLIYTVDVKNSKFNVSAEGSINGKKIANSGIETLDIKDFATSDGQGKCPSTINVSTCETFKNSANTVIYSLHTGSILGNDVMSDVKKVCNNQAIKVETMNTYEAPQKNIKMMCAYVEQDYSDSHKEDIQYIVSIENADFNISLNKYSIANITKFQTYSSINKRYLSFKDFSTSNGKAKCPDNIWMTQWVSDLSGDGTTNLITVVLHTESSINSNLSTEISTKINSFTKPAPSLTKKLKLYTKSGEEIVTGNNTTEQEGGCGFIGPNTLEIIEWIIKIIRIIVPILIIALGMTDFASVLFNGEDKNFKDAGTKFLKRLIAGIILIFVPYILALLINISGITGDYDINPDNIFCVFTLD